MSYAPFHSNNSNFFLGQASVGHGSSGGTDFNFSNQMGLGPGGSNSSGVLQPSAISNPYAPSHVSQIPPDMVLEILESASQKMLLASGNPVFLRLYNENIRLNDRLDVERNHHHDHSTSSPIVPTAPPMPTALPTSSSAATTSSSGLVIPLSPPQLDKDDYPEADECWWEREVWTAHVALEKSKGRKPPKIGFLTDALGQPVSNERLKSISKAARTLWVTLYQFRQEPDHWGSRNKEASDYFSNSMRLQFQEFQLCENDWKIDAFATLRYPDWKVNRDDQTLKRNKPSFNSTLKRKNPPNIVSLANAKVKKAKKSATKAPIDVDAIGIDSDGDVEIVSENPKPLQAATSPSTAPQPPAAPAPPSTPPPLAQPPRESSLPPPPPPRQPSPLPPPPPRQPSPLPPPPPQPIGLPELPPGEVSKRPGCSEGSIGIMPPATNALEPVRGAQYPALPTPIAQSPRANDADQPLVKPLESEVVTPSAAGEAGGVTSRGRSRRQGANLLQNLPIPRPPTDVMAPITNTSNAVSQTAPATASKGRGRKGDTLLRDNGTTSARNLYAIAYLAEHGETSADDFKSIWDNLPSEVVKEYKLKSTAAKKKN